MRIRSLVFPVVVLAVTIGGAATAHAQAFLDVVTPDGIGGPRWTGQVLSGGGLKFVETPTPEDDLFGSLEFTAKDDHAYAAVRNSEATWHFKLSETHIRYNVLTGGKQCGPSPSPNLKKKAERSLIVVLDVDTDGDLIADDVLVYDPTLSGKVPCNTFQNFDATAGKWYALSDKRDPKAAAAPLEDYLTEHPDTRIVLGGIHIATGPGPQPLVANLESVSIEGPPACTITPEGGICIDGPFITTLFRPVSPF